MNLGVDFHGTLTGKKNRQLLYALLFTLIGHDQIHVISHCEVGNEEQTQMIIESQGFPFTSINIVSTNDYAMVPQHKLNKALQLGIDMFFDDRLDTCELLAKHGILTFHTL